MADPLTHSTGPMSRGTIGRRTGCRFADPCPGARPGPGLAVGSPAGRPAFATCRDRMAARPAGIRATAVDVAAAPTPRPGPLQ